MTRWTCNLIEVILETLKTSRQFLVKGRLGLSIKFGYKPEIVALLLKQIYD
jgi:hypothetical protein